MRRLFTIVFTLLIAGVPPVRAADPNQIFGTILGEIGRQIERDREKKQLKRLRPLWEACANGDVAACDHAARFPFLSDEDRANLVRMRDDAQIRPAYERNFYACQKMDRTACQAALAYPYLNDTDRENLLTWKQAANQRHEALASFRQNQRNCYAGLISACDAAISERHLDESAIPDIERQRARLQQAEQERRAQERQRGQLQRAERQRRARDQQRQAALREYAQLHDDCAGGKRAACKAALAHSQVQRSDVAFLEGRNRELAPIAERVGNFFSQADLGRSNDSGSHSSLGFALLGVIALFGVGAGTFFVMRKRTAAAPARPEPPVLEPEPPDEAPEQETAQMFTLTGHMPTDVRRAIVAANP